MERFQPIDVVVVGNGCGGGKEPEDIRVVMRRHGRQKDVSGFDIHIKVQGFDRVCCLVHEGSGICLSPMRWLMDGKVGARLAKRMRRRDSHHNISRGKKLEHR